MVGCPFGCSDNSQCHCSQPLKLNTQIDDKEPQSKAENILAIVDEEHVSVEPINVDLTDTFITDKVCLKFILNLIYYIYYLNLKN